MDSNGWLPAEDYLTGMYYLRLPLLHVPSLKDECREIDYDYESAYSTFFQPEMAENIVDNIQPTSNYYCAPPTTTAEHYLYQRDAHSCLVSPDTEPDINGLQLNKGQMSEGRYDMSPTFSLPSGSTVNGYPQIPNIALDAPFTLDNRVDLFGVSSVQHYDTHTTSSATHIPSSSTATNGHQQAPNATSSLEFNSSVDFPLGTPYAPSSAFFINYSNAMPPPRCDGATLRRRGPNINGIEKRRERGPSFFCDMTGCNNVGFTTRASLNRHVKDKHSGKEHICTVCLRAFADSTSVNRHERDKHERVSDRRRKEVEP